MRSAFALMMVGCASLVFARGGAVHAAPVLGTIEQAIVGGEELAAEEVSATALIGTCDATLVAPRLLLTAAHCLPDRPAYAWFGSSHEAAAFQVAIERCVAHPDYRKVLGADLAFCELRGDTSPVVPATVVGACEPADESNTGAPLWLVGHGYALAPNVAGSRRVARSVEVEVNALVSEGRELLVGDNAHGACHGDSGGSVFALSADGAPRLVGIISRRGPDAMGGPGDDCASTTLVTALRPRIGWLAAAAQLEPTRCRSSEYVRAATDDMGCSVQPALPPRVASVGLLLACAALLWGRRSELRERPCRRRPWLRESR